MYNALNVGRIYIQYTLVFIRWLNIVGSDNESSLLTIRHFLNASGGVVRGGIPAQWSPLSRLETLCIVYFLSQLI